MLHLSCRRPSEGARKLTALLRERGIEVTRGRRVSRATHLVCWGPSDDTPGDYRRTLNILANGDKLHELETMALCDVPVVPFAYPPLMFEPDGGEQWYPRRRNHRGGSDLLNGCSRPDYFVRRLPLFREFRVHVFRGLAVRAALKVGGEGWIRNHDAGWHFDYGSACQAVIRQRHRDLAKSAVLALGLEFGAVDVADVDPDYLRTAPDLEGLGAEGDSWREPGSCGYPAPSIVLEVNTAPGLDNDNTAAKYADKIAEWYGEPVPSP